MSFLGQLMGFEHKVVDASNLTWSVLDPGASSKTGLSVNETTALRVSAVYGCCRVIAEDIGKLPLKLIQEMPNGAKRVAKEHSLYRLLNRRPNEWQTSMEWRMTMMIHALLNRGGYSWINRSPSDGRVIELIPLQPHRVTVKQDRHWNISYEVSDGDGHIATMLRDDVHVVHGLSWNGFSALDLITQSKEAIGLAMASEETQARLHGQGAKPGGILTTTAVLTKEQIDRLKEQFAANYSGVANAFKTLLLDNGLKFEPWSMTGVDGQHLETRKHQVEEICRFFRVFPQMIGASSAIPTYASAESFFGAHVVHTLMPWVAMWEQAMMRDLLTESEIQQGYEAKFMLQGLLRGSAADRSAFYGSGIDKGWMTRNEVRKLEDLDPLPGLDEIITPMNMQPGAGGPAAEPDDGEEEPDDPPAKPKPPKK